MKSRKVLLIYPRFTVPQVNLVIPMNLMYLGSYLLRHDYAVRILNGCNIESSDELYRQIKSEINDTMAIGLSVMTQQVPSALGISKMVRDISPGLPIIWGGVHPTLYPRQVASSGLVDFAVHGEGEITAVELLKHLTVGNREPSGIRGIAYKSGDSPNNVVITPARELLNMDELPQLEWGLLEYITPIKDIIKISELTGRGLLIQTTRGCPWHCTFCINSILKNKYRYRSLNLVMEDIRQVIELGVNRITFMDEDFFANRKRARTFADMVREKGLNFKWYANARADYFGRDYLSREFLAELKQIGLSTIGLGFESGSERILKKLRKEITCQDTIKTAERLDEAGIGGEFSCMMGLPDEYEDDMKATLKLIQQIIERDSQSRFIILGPQVFRPYPGSALYLECLKYGMNEPTSLEEWAVSPYLAPESNLIEVKFYPWIRVSDRRLNVLTFYGWLWGAKSRFKLLNNLVRQILKWRSRSYSFRMPFEMNIYYGLKKFRLWLKVTTFLRRNVAGSFIY
jgi:anaerobic magnesium-protoporphyrin IX monomethyl ester cyclase